MKQFRKALAVPLADSGITVCLAATVGDGQLPTIERLQVAEGLLKEFVDICGSMMGSCQKGLNSGDAVLVPYEAGSRPDAYEVEFLNEKDHDFVSGQLQAIGSLADIPVFQQDEEFISNLLFYVVVVTTPIGSPLLFFRVYSPSKELSRSKLFLALFSNGQYDRVRDPGLLFDHKIDCVAHDGYLFIFNKNNFQRIFQYFEMVKKSAREALEVIRGSIPISNFDDFEQACEGHLQKLAKLKNISQRPYLKTLTVKDLKKVIQ